MPEYPDLTVYLEALGERLDMRSGKAVLLGVRLFSPFVLRTAVPPVSMLAGRRVTGLRRLGKRLVLGLEGELFAAIHLMIAGRLHWRPSGAKPPGRAGLAAFDFPTGTLLLTEAGTQRRAMLHLFDSSEALNGLDAGGLEVMDTTLPQFDEVLRRERHTLKRALTDPRLFAAIGNAYSDEILHRARLSPVRMSTDLDAAEVQALFEATRSVLTEWTQRLRDDVARSKEGFPEKVTAFRPEMAVHGKYRSPCPDCGSPIQRIVRGAHETNYCAKCQTGGKLLADRSLSRLLKSDWPKTLEELEERRHRPDERSEARAAPTASHSSTPASPRARRSHRAPRKGPAV